MANKLFSGIRMAFSAVAVSMVFASVGSAAAVDLITEDEARLRTAPKLTPRGGITRGLGIKVVSPNPDALSRRRLP